jgi:hypothetical protein
MVFVPLKWGVWGSFTMRWKMEACQAAKTGWMVFHFRVSWTYLCMHECAMKGMRSGMLPICSGQCSAGDAALPVPSFQLDMGCLLSQAQLLFVWCLSSR